MEPKTAAKTLAALIGQGRDALQSGLRRGSHRPREVAALQSLLHELGFGKQEGSLELVGDGNYGDTTVAAVRAFAGANGSQAKGETVTLPLATKIVARFDSLEHLRQLDHDVARRDVTTYRKNGGLEKHVRSLQALLRDLGASTKVSGVYDSSTKKAVKELVAGKGDDGRPLTLEAARTLVDKVSRRYGDRWRDPGALPVDLPKDEEPPRDPGPPKPDREATGKRDFSTSNGITARLLGVQPVGQELENWCWAASTQMMIGYLRSLDETECPTCGRSGHHDEDITQARQMNRRLGDSEVDCSIERTAGFDYKTCDRGGWPHFFEFQDRVQSTEWASKRHVLEEHGLVLRDGGARLRLRHRLSDWQIKALNYKSGREFRKRLDNAEGAALSWEMLTYLLDHQRPVAFAFRYPHPSAGHMRLAVGYAVTPGDRRWVAVADPLPPGTGEVHLIPYGYYRDGPFDGHWRDYWVPPAAEEGSPQHHRHGCSKPAVGRELVASYITYPEDPHPEKSKTGGERLSPEDSAAAFLEAKEGLRAVEAIASAAKPMAIRLGMGGAFVRGWGRLLGGSRDLELDFKEVEPGDLELDAKERIPVYELTKSELENWVPGDPPDLDSLSQLLDRPREIIYEITRPKQTPLTFFATVTVRRKGDKWKLASLGKTYLMALFMAKEFGESQSAAFGGQAPSAERLVRFFGAFDEEGTAEEIAEQIKAARQLDEDTRRKRKKKRQEELEELEKALRSNAKSYPQGLWKARDARGPDEPDERKDSENWLPWVKFWSDFWQELRDKEGRGRCRRLAEELQSRATEELRLRKRFVDRLPVPIHQARHGWYESEESLLDLVEREEEIERLCAEWPETEPADRGKKLEKLFEKIRDQDIAWLRRRFLESDRESLEEKQLAKLQDEDIDGSFRSRRAKYVIEVPELYQLLVAYRASHVKATAEPHLEDEVFPVYEKSFHRPERRVQEGSLLDVLKDLQDVANEREVSRGR